MYFEIFMNWFVVILIFLFAGFISTGRIGPNNRRRVLEKELLWTLQRCHAGIELKSVNDNSVVGAKLEKTAADTFYGLPLDMQRYILSFLSTKNLLSTRLVSPQFRLLSESAIFSKICSFNPKFVLKEAWMNFAMSKFLEDFFIKGFINADWLFSTVDSVFNIYGPREISEIKYPISFAFTAFLYEYQHGIGSSAPMAPNELYIEILSALRDNSELDFSLSNLLTESFCLESRGISAGERNNRNAFINETIEFIASKPDADAIKSFFHFDPRLPLGETRLKELPSFFRVAMLNFLLPLCEEEERFMEAIEIASSAYTFSQFLLDQLEVKFPHLVDEMLNRNVTDFPAGQRALVMRQRPIVAGLDYLLSRNTENRFDLQELLQLNPDISLLMSAYLPCNKMSLTEVDMIHQMQEAGLFDGIQDRRLRENIDAVIFGYIRSAMSVLYNEVVVYWNAGTT